MGGLVLALMALKGMAEGFRLGSRILKLVKRRENKAFSTSRRGSRGKTNSSSLGYFAGKSASKSGRHMEIRVSLDHLASPSSMRFICKIHTRHLERGLAKPNTYTQHMLFPSQENFSSQGGRHALTSGVQATATG